jgi:hypothetical protein
MSTHYSNAPYFEYFMIKGRVLLAINYILFGFQHSILCKRQCSIVRKHQFSVVCKLLQCKEITQFYKKCQNTTTATKNIFFV